jgi:hypothetical protein
MAEQLPCREITSELIIVTGQNHPSWLNCEIERKNRLNRTSTDRLKRVQEITNSCYEQSALDEDEGTDSTDTITFDSPLGGPTLRIGNPVAALVKCDKRIFLAVGQINKIELGGQKDLLRIHPEMLGQSSAKIGFQICRLQLATREDDPEERHGWGWSKSMERNCTDVRTARKLAYVSESKVLT